MVGRSLTSQLDTNASFDMSFETPRGDLVESFDQLDAAVKLLEPPQLSIVLALPCAASRDCRSEGFESPVKLGELDVVSGDLRVEVSDAAFDFTAPGATRPSADRAEPVGAGGGTLRAAAWRRRFWTPTTRAPDLAPLRVHDMRRTAVALWIAAGANPKQIAAWAGHTSVAVVLDRYGHLFEGHESAVQSRLDAFAECVSVPSGDAESRGFSRVFAGFSSRSRRLPACRKAVDQLKQGWT